MKKYLFILGLLIALPVLADTLGTTTIEGPLTIAVPGTTGEESLKNIFTIDGRVNPFGYGGIGVYSQVGCNKLSSIIQTHHLLYTDPNNVHDHLSFYTSNKDCTSTLKRLDIPFGIDTARWEFSDSWLYLPISTNTPGIQIEATSTVQTNPMLQVASKYGYYFGMNKPGGYGLKMISQGNSLGSIGMMFIQHTNTTDTIPVATIDNRSQGAGLVVKNNTTEFVSVRANGIMDFKNSACPSVIDAVTGQTQYITVRNGVITASTTPCK